MTGFYGDGATKHGIFGDTLRSIVRRITGREPPVEPHPVARGRALADRKPDIAYPSVELTPEAKATIRKIGLPTYATGGKVDDEA